MERVELALKNTVQKEKALTVTEGAHKGEDFFVDELLNFPNDDVFVEDETELKKGASVSLIYENTLNECNDISTAGENLGSSELAVPMDDLAELEWLSNFVDDSCTPYSAPTKKPDWLTSNRRRPVKEESCFKTPLPVKIRSKRARTGVSVWSSSSTTSSSSSSSSPSREKNKKKKPFPEVCGQTQTRRCSHCGVQKTPQWRAGPMGAKTLCNACGVRYKSGRLLPEYRPACSPTFSVELHSNSHRKVVEMRRKKEMSETDETGLNKPVQVLSSF